MKSQRVIRRNYSKGAWEIHKYLDNLIGSLTVTDKEEVRMDSKVYRALCWLVSIITVPLFERRLIRIHDKATGEFIAWHWMRTS